MEPKQIVLEAFPRACMGKHTKGYAVMQSAISWGEPVGAPGKTQREAWENAAKNIPNWEEYWRKFRSSNNEVRGAKPNG